MVGELAFVMPSVDPTSRQCAVPEKCNDIATTSQDEPAEVVNAMVGWPVEVTNPVHISYSLLFVESTHDPALVMVPTNPLVSETAESDPVPAKAPMKKTNRLPDVALGKAGVVTDPGDSAPEIG